MVCPRCQKTSLVVLEKRNAEDSIRRRRMCQACQYRFTTYERAEIPQLTVLKRDGSRESYNEDKVTSGIAKACKNRPVQPAQIAKTTQSITKELRSGTSEVVSSNHIGELVLEHLRNLDQLAYLRFASVHRQFADLGDFKKEIKQLEQVTRPNI